MYTFLHCVLVDAFWLGCVGLCSARMYYCLIQGTDFVCTCGIVLMCVCFQVVGDVCMYSLYDCDLHVCILYVIVAVVAWQLH